VRCAEHVDRIRELVTTGAGDAFLGSLALSLARGAALPDAVATAVRVGSIAVRHAGPQLPRGIAQPLTLSTPSTLHHFMAYLRRGTAPSLPPRPLPPVAARAVYSHLRSRSQWLAARVRPAHPRFAPHANRPAQDVPAPTYCPVSYRPVSVRTFSTSIKASAPVPARRNSHGHTVRRRTTDHVSRSRRFPPGPRGSTPTHCRGGTVDPIMCTLVVRPDALHLPTPPDPVATAPRPARYARGYAWAGRSVTHPCTCAGTCTAGEL
jgi:hypothetical protein